MSYLFPDRSAARILSSIYTVRCFTKRKQINLVTTAYDINQLLYKFQLRRQPPIFSLEGGGINRQTNLL